MTMTNAEWMLKNGYKFSDLYAYGKYNVDGVWIWNIQHLKAGIDEMSREQSHDNVITAWLDEEHKEPILDDDERRYLKGVIRPFRGRAVFVKKIYHTGYTVDYEQIIIRVKSIATLIADIPLPFFKKGEMYKGMKLNREYTLEELGL